MKNLNIKKWFFKISKSLLIGSAIGIGVAIFTNLFFKDLIDRLEDQTYYMRYKWEVEDISSNKNEKLSEYNDKGIYIIDIDERSLHKLGKYQNWDRSYHAQMIKSISKYFPAAIAFDVMFFDPDDHNYIERFERLIDTCKSKSPKCVIPKDTYNQIISNINYDEQFINATAEAGNVFHALMMADKTDYSSYAQSQIEHLTTIERHLSLNPSSAIILPSDKRSKLFDRKPILDGIFPKLAQAARAIGFVNIPKNSDGVIREIPLLYAFGNHPPVYLPLSVRIAASLFGTPNNEIIFEPEKYLDIGKPFKAFKDSSGNLSFSYPNFTPQMVKAIIDKGKEILSCKTDSIVEITSLLKAGREINGEIYIDMYCGIFPELLLKKILNQDPSKIINLPIGDSLLLDNSITIKRNSSSEWIITAPYGEEEWYLSKTQIETLMRLKMTDFNDIKNGQTKLIFYDFSVINKKNILYSTIPIINDSVLRDLIKAGWQTIENLSSGMRMDFGKPVRIPLGKNNRHIVTYFGPKAKTFQYFSFYDIMKDRVKGKLEGKIFLVGATVQGLFDIVSTPVDNNYPGVEVHASLLNSFLTNTFITRLTPWQDLLILLIVGIIVGFCSFFLKPLLGAILSVIFIFAYFLLAMTVFGANHLWIEIARPVLTIVISYTAIMAFRYVTEEKDRKFLQSTFKQYLSPELIDIMYNSKQKPMLGGEEGIRTAYFTDIQGFSTFSEKLGSPTRLVELLNEYLTEMTDILLKHYGTLDKYEGDAIIAFFGAPMPMDDHAKHACLTALEMQKRLSELRIKWKSEGDKWPTIVHEMRMRIGINSGLIVTGNMGSRTRMNYTMMGDAVNLAARLESAAKQYGVFTMISHYTYDMVKTILK